MSFPLISLRDVSFSYVAAANTRNGIFNANLQIQRGEFVAICGASGSGKSTLLYLIGGMLKPQQGELIIDGLTVAQGTDSQWARLRRDKIGFVFQQFYLLPRLTVLQNLLLAHSQDPAPTVNYNTMLARAQHYAEKFSLADKLHCYPQQLSGGQQQRVAILRALMQRPVILLADEPTGNLDSANTQHVMNMLLQLQREEGLTILLVTHDKALASQAQRCITVTDGQLNTSKSLMAPCEAQAAAAALKPQARIGAMLAKATTQALATIRYNARRVGLTMLGVVIGVAAILATLTLGDYSKQAILQTYQGMGIDTFSLHGYPNWNIPASALVGAPFNEFNQDSDLKVLRRAFPQINYLSPVLELWGASLWFAGKQIDQAVMVQGVNQAYLPISHRKLWLGQNFSSYHINFKRPVCIIGIEVAKRLFAGSTPLEKLLQVKQNQVDFNCRVIGVLAPQDSQQSYFDDNLMVLLPYSYLQTAANWWDRQMHAFIAQVTAGVDVRQIGNGVKRFFEHKYGASGRFMISGNTMLVAQMYQFVTLFTLTLTIIAAVALVAGCVGVANMMLVVLNERLQEIGLRRALGATENMLFLQILLEAIIICSVGGFIGIAMGVACYQTMIFIASTLIPQIKFVWVLNLAAVTITLLTIFTVGIISGIVPARRAKVLDVLAALKAI